MPRLVALVLALVALSMLSVAATWVWGPWGLGGSALVLLATALLTPTSEGVTRAKSVD